MGCQVPGQVGGLGLLAHGWKKCGLALQIHCKVSLDLPPRSMIRSAESFRFSIGPGVDHRDPV